MADAGEVVCDYYSISRDSHDGKGKLLASRFIASSGDTPQAWSITEP